jgi:transposase
MLMSPLQYQIFLYPKPVDLRSGVDGLSRYCRVEMQMNPRGGAIFLFFNRSRDRVKILFHDGSGACIFYKILDRGRFQIPKSSDERVSLPSSQLSLLLEGTPLLGG